MKSSVCSAKFFFGIWLFAFGAVLLTGAVVMHTNSTKLAAVNQIFDWVSCAKETVARRRATVADSARFPCEMAAAAGKISASIPVAIRGEGTHATFRAA